MASTAGARQIGVVTSGLFPIDPRIRPLAGAHNLRDLGGLRTDSGDIVRTGRIFRSDYPLFVDADVEGTRELGLRTVVDLRRANEVSVECVDWPALGVACERWPLSAGRESSWRARYPAYLEHRPETVVGAVRAVMRPEAHAVLFHCAAGKDRTGVVAALLLSLLGVADDDIVDDYVLSAASVEPVITRLNGIDLYATMLADSSVRDQEPKAEYLHGLLEWLGGHGGAEAWLVERGTPAVEVDGFRAAMLMTGGGGESLD